MRYDDCGIPVYDNEEEMLEARAALEEIPKEPETAFCPDCKMAVCEETGECEDCEGQPAWVKSLLSNYVNTPLVQRKKRFAKAIGDLCIFVNQGHLKLHVTRYESAAVLVQACFAGDFIEACQLTRQAYYSTTSDGANRGVIPLLGGEPLKLWNDIISAMQDMDVI